MATLQLPLFTLRLLAFTESRPRDKWPRKRVEYNNGRIDISVFCEQGMKVHGACWTLSASTVDLEGSELAMADVPSHLWRTTMLSTCNCLQTTDFQVATKPWLVTCMLVSYSTTICFLDSHDRYMSLRGVLGICMVCQSQYTSFGNCYRQDLIHCGSIACKKPLREFVNGVLCQLVMTYASCWIEVPVDIRKQIVGWLAALCASWRDRV